MINEGLNKVKSLISRMNRLDEYGSYNYDMYEEEENDIEQSNGSDNDVIDNTSSADNAPISTQDSNTGTTITGSEIKKEIEPDQQTMSFFYENEFWKPYNDTNLQDLFDYAATTDEGEIQAIRKLSTILNGVDKEKTKKNGFLVASNTKPISRNKIAYSNASILVDYSEIKGMVNGFPYLNSFLYSILNNLNVSLKSNKNQFQDVPLKPSFYGLQYLKNIIKNSNLGFDFKEIDLHNNSKYLISPELEEASGFNDKNKQIARAIVATLNIDKENVSATQPSSNGTNVGGAQSSSNGKKKKNYGKVIKTLSLNPNLSINEGIDDNGLSLFKVFFDYILPIRDRLLSDYVMAKNLGANITFTEITKFILGKKTENGEMIDTKLDNDSILNITYNLIANYLTQSKCTGKLEPNVNFPSPQYFDSNPVGQDELSKFVDNGPKEEKIKWKTVKKLSELMDDDVTEYEFPNQKIYDNFRKIESIYKKKYKQGTPEYNAIQDFKEKFKLGEIFKGNENYILQIMIRGFKDIDYKDLMVTTNGGTAHITFKDLLKTISPDPSENGRGIGLNGEEMIIKDKLTPILGGGNLSWQFNSDKTENTLGSNVYGMNKKFYEDNYNVLSGIGKTNIDFLSPKYGIFIEHQGDQHYKTKFSAAFSDSMNEFFPGANDEEKIKNYFDKIKNILNNTTSSQNSGFVEKTDFEKETGKNILSDTSLDYFPGDMVYGEVDKNKIDTLKENLRLKLDDIYGASGFVATLTSFENKNKDLAKRVLPYPKIYNLIKHEDVFSNMDEKEIRDYLNSIISAINFHEPLQDVSTIRKAFEDGDLKKTYNLDVAKTFANSKRRWMDEIHMIIDMVNDRRKSDIIEKNNNWNLIYTVRNFNDIKFFVKLFLNVPFKIFEAYKMDNNGRVLKDPRLHPEVAKFNYKFEPRDPDIVNKLFADTYNFNGKKLEGGDSIWTNESDVSVKFSNQPTGVQNPLQQVVEELKLNESLDNTKQKEMYGDDGNNNPNPKTFENRIKKIVSDVDRQQNQTNTTTGVI